MGLGIAVGFMDGGEQTGLQIIQFMGVVVNIAEVSLR
jgi:hypothetical protein